ncbi:MAG: MerR family transcriptional regulator [Bryobacteraceae bacterium]
MNKGRPAIDALQLGQVRHLFSSNDVSRIAQVSLRQLQWWDERGLISPHHESHRRFYQPLEVLEILIMTELRRKGLSLGKLRGTLRFLKREIEPHIIRAADDKTDLYLATDLKSFHLEQRAEGILQLFTKARHPMFLVCVSDHLKRLASEKSSHAWGKQMRLF